MDVHHSTNTMDVHYTNGAAPGLGILRESLIFMAMILEMEAKQYSRRLVDRCGRDSLPMQCAEAKVCSRT